MTVHPLNSHEEHQLDDRCRAEQLGEGIDEEVIGQQQELQGEHEAVAAGLQHLPLRSGPEGTSPGPQRAALARPGAAGEDQRCSFYSRQEPVGAKKKKISG